MSETAPRQASSLLVELFDPTYYLEHNPDVAVARVDPLDHYLRHGAAEGRDPHPGFDTSYYLTQNPDVAASGMNPLEHYARFGAAEGRLPHAPDPLEGSVSQEVVPDAATNPSDRLGDLTGFFDERFTTQTEISDSEALSFVRENPGYDCYIFNPLTFQAAFFASVWDQSEHWNPGAIGLANRILHHLGLNIDARLLVDTPRTTAFGDHWVASERFWRAYVDFQRPLLAAIDDYAAEAGSAGVTADRFFGAFVRQHPEFSLLPYRYPAEAQARRTGEWTELMILANWLKEKCDDSRGQEEFTQFERLSRFARTRLDSFHDR